MSDLIAVTGKPPSEQQMKEFWEWARNKSDEERLKRLQEMDGLSPFQILVHPMAASGVNTTDKGFIKQEPN